MEGYKPSWSPDGKRMAYVTVDDQVVVGTLADGTTRTVASGFSNSQGHLSWSPDSRQIAFPGAGDGNDRDAWVVAADGEQPARRLPAPGDDANVDWGPQGRLASSGDLGLFTFDSDGGNRRQIWGEPLAFGELEWSPDGSMLVTLPNLQYNLIQADGTNPRQVGGGKAPPSDAHSVSWSSSSRELALWGPLGSVRGVWVAPSDGGSGRMVAEGVTNAVWSPTGDLIAGIASDPGGEDLVVFAPDGSARRVVADLPSQHGILPPLAWSPDGRSIAFEAHVWPPLPHPPIRPGLPEGALERAPRVDAGRAARAVRELDRCGCGLHGVDGRHQELRLLIHRRNVARQRPFPGVRERPLRQGPR